MQVATNYPFMLSQLRAAAGPDTTIAVMTYYNPLLPPCRFADLAPFANFVLEGGGPLPEDGGSTTSSAARRPPIQSWPSPDP
jgi:hypothetical protein